jgi:uncharacterized protein with GYD domain
MPRYVSLIDWTQQGIANFKDTVNRYEAAEQQFEQSWRPFHRCLPPSSRLRPSSAVRVSA